MYSYEDRKRTVELYIEDNLSAADVIRELGYPNRHSLRMRTARFSDIDSTLCRWTMRDSSMTASMTRRL